MPDPSPPPSDPETIAGHVAGLARGEAGAADQLFPIVYDQLHALAGRWFRGARGREHTLQPTALVHEAFLKLLPRDGQPEGAGRGFESRAHFVAVAATAMRQILANHARDKRRLKRGGDREQVTLSGVQEDGGPSFDLLTLDESLDRLRDLDPAMHRVAELKLFGELSAEEIALVVGDSSRTVERRWRGARAWLRSQLQPETEDGDPK